MFKQVSLLLHNTEIISYSFFSRAFQEAASLVDRYALLSPHHSVVLVSGSQGLLCVSSLHKNCYPSPVSFLPKASATCYFLCHSDIPQARVASSNCLNGSCIWASVPTLVPNVFFSSYTFCADWMWKVAHWMVNPWPHLGLFYQSRQHLVGLHWKSYLVFSVISVAIKSTACIPGSLASLGEKKKILYYYSEFFLLILSVSKAFTVSFKWEIRRLYLKCCL